MAAVTLGIEFGSSTDATSYNSGDFTPAASDLLVALACGRATAAAGSFASSDAGKTYAEVTTAVFATSADKTWAYVAEQAADADLQSGTLDLTGDGATAGYIVILRVSGMTNVGAAAIRQSKVASNQSASTPTITFDAACLTGNPTLFVVMKGGATGITEPTGWTEIGDPTSATPAGSLQVFARDSGFTGDTITGGGADPTGNYCVIGIELDASAGGAYDLPADSAAYAYTANDAGLEFDRQVVADAAAYAYTANDAALEFDRQIGADSAAYAWTATDASLEYTPVGSTYTLAGDSAVYLWSATDADLVYTALNHYSLDADPAAYTWTADAAGLEWSGFVADTGPSGYGGGGHVGGHDDLEMRVRAHWEEIDRLRAENRTREKSEERREREIEQSRAELARLEQEKRRVRGIAERKRVLRAEIAAVEEGNAELRAAIDEAEERIVVLEAAIEAERARREMILRRRQMMLALMLVATQ